MKETVSRFAREVVAPKVKQMDEQEKFDDGVIKALFDSGLMGIEVSPDYGGSGSSFMSSIVAVEELARVDPCVSLAIDIQNTLSNTILTKYGTEEQRQKYLTRMATETFCSFCLSESTSGSDAFAMKTLAVPSSTSGAPEHWTLTGEKMWISQAELADIFLVFAQTDPSKGYKGITCFIVEKGWGVQVGKKEKKLGMRASPTSTVTFDGLVVPNANVVGKVGEGYKIAIGLLNEGRIGIAAQMLGLAQGAFDVSMKYMLERKQFGKAIADFQGMQFQYAQLSTELEAARLLTYNAGRMRDQGLDFRMHASMAKLYTSQVAEKVASAAIEWMGGVGFTRDVPVEKFYRDCKVGKIYEGTSNIQLQGIAKMIADKYK
ncbi:mitochondrial acyl-CoA dehydrogenase [Gonapodya prolifera JEL478]|uniref:Short/branched chain specific acyl-CoA dehydrogenase, mitochondrial n=1 Tax=Gonapodya prolifera (strain JEL478) TaxID=1344416 RepID=A0A139A4Z2_GONPJ|nr:mitochondrial acyl-CoA dehydrogenase [Gonapodya prolifera JEL478]|eukprot:KXS11698.1 mitochondrial acyl-CoA dehydrogenase [Gonapodya prolifera JEL478]